MAPNAGVDLVEDGVHELEGLEVVGKMGCRIFEASRLRRAHPLLVRDMTSIQNLDESMGFTPFTATIRHKGQQNPMLSRKTGNEETSNNIASRALAE